MSKILTINFYFRNKLVNCIKHTKYAASFIRCVQNKTMLYPEKKSLLESTYHKLYVQSIYLVQNKLHCTKKLPPHTILKLPSLSPTMETGTIISWAKKEGDEIKEGDLIAEIETDKATMAFEATDDGFLAKILVPAGTKNVPINKDVCVVVSNKEDIAAFKEYKTSQDVSTEEKILQQKVAPTTKQKVGTIETIQPKLPQVPTPEVPHVILRLPALSPTMETGTVVSWAKKEGDEIKEGDLIAEIETDKATMGLEASDEGFLAKILIPAGTKNVPINKEVCVIVSSREHINTFKDFAVTATQVVPKEQKVQPKEQKAQPKEQVPNDIKTAKVKPRIPSITFTHHPKQLIPPGKIEIKKHAKEKKKMKAAALKRKENPYIDIPVTPERKAITKQLEAAKMGIPHLCVGKQVDVWYLEKLRSSLNQKSNKKLNHITLTHFFMKATANACKIVPQSNSTWSNQGIVQYGPVNISLAVATNKGLVYPTIFDVGHKSILEISKETQSIVDKARRGNLQPQECEGGTFSISNLGMYGVKSFSNIVNIKQACALATGSTFKVLKHDIEKNKLYETTKVNVSLVSDHRIVDGTVSAQWLDAFKNYIEFDLMFQ